MRASDSGPIHAFAGACLLTAALLFPHAPRRPVIGGMALAGLIRYGWLYYRRPNDPDV